MAKPKGPDFSKNLLFYGDNLHVMRKYMADESVDLVYLDPPFNSNRNYNVLFKQKSGDEAAAQITAFDDTWTWGQDDEQAFAELQATAAPKVADAIGAMHQLIGPSDMLSYLVMMTQRLVELQRVLKPNGSLYIHCDPVASHYLKLLLDAVFGINNFKNEISWKRSANRSSISKIYRRAHDVLLFYSKSSTYNFNLQYRALSDGSRSIYSKSDDKGAYRLVPLLVSGKRNGNTGQPWRGIDPNTRGKAGMHWITTHDKLEGYTDRGLVVWPSKEGGAPNLKYYLEDNPGVPLSDFWDDVALIRSNSAESLGYPTQKPVALLERIIAASSNEGDVVFDPFCGCGTTVDAAQRLGRRWIGIDISYLSVDLIDTRLVDTYGSDVRHTFQVIGLPADVGGARSLFNHSPFEFERWAVSLVEGTPNEKQVGDRGVDGVIRFPLSGNATGRVLVSVKGGKQLNPAMVRDLGGTVEAQKDAVMGILITIDSPTKGMIEAANHSGTFFHELTGTTYPRLQLLTVEQLLTGSRPHMPTPYMPYLQAQKFVPDAPKLPGL